jgi:hypothetical protein
MVKAGQPENQVVLAFPPKKEEVKEVRKKE